MVETLRNLPYFVYIILALLSALVAAFSQIILKISADKTYSSHIREYINLPVISAYGLFMLSFVFSYFALYGLDFSVNSVINASSYIFVAALGYFIIKEKINLWKAGGLALIVAGIIIAVLKV